LVLLFLFVSPLISLKKEKRRKETQF